MLSINPQYTSQLIPVTAPIDHTKELACSIMEFSKDERCLTLEIAHAAMNMLKSDKTSAQAAIFRNALECGYQKQLLDMIHDQYSAFVPSPALRAVLADEGIMLGLQDGNLTLTRTRAEPEVNPFCAVTSEALNELGLPKAIAALICTKATISPLEKNGGIQQYLGTDITAWTHQQINDALIDAFNTFRPLPEGMNQLEITDFEFSVPKGRICTVPGWIRLNQCRSTSSLLAFRNGTVTATQQGATVVALGPQSCAIAGASNVTVRARDGGIAVAAAENSKAEAFGRESTAAARAAGATAIARNLATARALAPRSYATAYSGSLAIATAPCSFASVRSSGQKSDKDSVAVARGSLARAGVYVDHAEGVAIDGASVETRGMYSVIHAYGDSSADGMEFGAIVVKHSKFASVCALNGSKILDMAENSYPGVVFCVVDKIIYCLTDEEMVKLNAKTPLERRLFRRVLDEQISTPDALLQLYDELSRKQSMVTVEDLRAALIHRE